MSDARLCAAAGKRAEALELQRLTTVYHPLEDRMRLSGQLPSGEVVLLWVTQRLLSRVVAHLLAWLEQHSCADAGQTEVVQSLARPGGPGGAAPETPVPASGRPFLVESIDFSSSAQAVRLGFKVTLTPGEIKEIASLSLRQTALRQWLNILYAQWRQAGWPEALWPGWMTGAAALMVAEPARRVLH
ncbi:hypothetical protein [Desulfuromonas thiophila]|uniref:Uncharacterized protein n=1 Tax=Desulfuromonas thiophila TaxID=57664 RepID=A0A1G7EWF4_9BACT|nr:hypothetical protein [Desulfuromonas thiophila]SDE68020.1 hypothetical protein SAMN05661003_12410 [Desulfuromonas thiophila]